MDSNQILSELNTIFKDVLDNNKIQLTTATTAKDIEEWDSLSNIHLVIEIERHFKLKFTTSEIQSWKNIGELVNSIEKKTSK